VHAVLDTADGFITINANNIMERASEPDGYIERDAAVTS
jgi:hypothetical protein